MNRKKGIIAIIISALGFSLMNLFIPLSGNLPTIQKSFFRNLIAFLVASFVLLKDYKSGNFSKADFKNVSFKILILRSILELLVFTLTITHWISYLFLMLQF